MGRIETDLDRYISLNIRRKTCFIIPLYKKTLVEDYKSLQAKLPDKFMKLYANKIISIHVSCSDLIALMFTKILISYLFFVCSAYRKLVLSASPYIRRFIERNYRVQYYHRLIFLCWNKEPAYVFFTSIFIRCLIRRYDIWAR